MEYQTPHRKYLRIANIVCGLKDKKILEVGGCSPIELLRDYKPAIWTCANLDKPAVIEYNKQAEKHGFKNFSAYFVDVTKLDIVEDYDLVYSINAFEHIHDFEKALDRMFVALKPSGYLFTLFGPIWSSDVGHHLSIPTEDGKGLHFYDGVLAPWEHLTSTPKTLQVKLEKRYGVKTAERAITYIYDYPDLNRLYEWEYSSILKRSGFSEVLVLRNRQGIAPEIPGATNTREFFMLLKKGPVGILEKPVTFIKSAYAYFVNRMLEG